MNKISNLYFLLSIILIGGVFSAAYGQAEISNQKPEFFIDWSAQTFTPSEYQGKALPTFNSMVKLTATVAPKEGEEINESDYYFNWIIDSFIATPSKTSSESFEITKGGGGEHEIYLRIFNKNRDLVNTYFFFIPVAAPDVVIYKTNGNGALNNIEGILYASAGSELDLIAKPFFFNKISSESHLKYTWRLNGEEIKKNPLNPDKITFVFPAGIPIGAKYSLTLSVENPFDVYQLVEKNYTIIIK